MAKGDVSAGTNLTTSLTKATGNVEVGGTASMGSGRIGGDVSASGSVMIGGSANIGGNLSAGGSITIAGKSNKSVGESVQRKPAGEAPRPRPQAEPSPLNVPLQEVWPVERKQSDVTAHMERISPARESDTPVEFIQPRQPRPALPAERPPGRGPAERPQTEQVSDAQTVGTDIGPLPADLWQLLGRTPPSEQAESREKAPAPIQRRTQKPPAGPEQVGQAPAVQREAAPEAPDSSTQAADEEEDGEVDVDALARRVYAEIRRKLKVEQERIRPR